MNNIDNQTVTAFPSAEAATPESDSVKAKAAMNLVAAAEINATPPAHMVVAKLQSGDFELDGLRVHFVQETVKAQPRLHCSAIIANLPYTAQNREKRSALSQIMLASHRLQHTRLRIDHSSQMRLDAFVPLPAQPQDEDVVLAMLGFYQEAKPFLKLIAEKL